MRRSSQSLFIKKIDLRKPNPDRTTITLPRRNHARTNPTNKTRAMEPKTPDQNQNIPYTYRRDRVIDPYVPPPKRTSSYEELLRKLQLRKIESRDRRLKEFLDEKKRLQEMKKLENEHRRKAFLLNRERINREEAERLLARERKRRAERMKFAARFPNCSKDHDSRSGQDRYKSYNCESVICPNAEFIRYEQSRPHDLNLSESTISLYGVERNKGYGISDSVESYKFRIHLPKHKSSKVHRTARPKIAPYRGRSNHHHMLPKHCATASTKQGQHKKEHSKKSRIENLPQTPSSNFETYSYDGPTAISLLKEAEAEVARKHRKKCTSYKLSCSNLYAPSKAPIRYRKPKTGSRNKQSFRCDCGQMLRDSQLEKPSLASLEPVTSKEEYHCVRVYTKKKSAAQTTNGPGISTKLAEKPSKTNAEQELNACKSDLEEERTTDNPSTVISDLTQNDSKATIKSVPCFRKTVIDGTQNDISDDGIDVTFDQPNKNLSQANSTNRTSTTVQCPDSSRSYDKEVDDDEYSETFLCEETSLIETFSETKNVGAQEPGENANNNIATGNAKEKRETHITAGHVETVKEGDDLYEKIEEVDTRFLFTSYNCSPYVYNVSPGPCANPLANFTTQFGYPNFPSLHTARPVIQRFDPSTRQYIPVAGYGNEYIVAPELITDAFEIPVEAHFAQIFSSEYGNIPENYFTSYMNPCGEVNYTSTCGSMNIENINSDTLIITEVEVIEHSVEIEETEKTSMQLPNTSASENMKSSRKVPSNSDISRNVAHMQINDMNSTYSQTVPDIQAEVHSIKGTTTAAGGTFKLEPVAIAGMASGNEDEVAPEQKSNEKQRKKGCSCGCKTSKANRANKSPEPSSGSPSNESFDITFATYIMVKENKPCGFCTVREPDKNARENEVKITDSQDKFKRLSGSELVLPDEGGHESIADESKADEGGYESKADELEAGKGGHESVEDESKAEISLLSPIGRELGRSAPRRKVSNSSTESAIQKVEVKDGRCCLISIPLSFDCTKKLEARVCCYCRPDKRPSRHPQKRLGIKGRRQVYDRNVIEPIPPCRYDPLTKRSYILQNVKEVNEDDDSENEEDDTRPSQSIKEEDRVLLRSNCGFQLVYVKKDKPNEKKEKRPKEGKGKPKLKNTRGMIKCPLDDPQCHLRRDRPRAFRRTYRSEFRTSSLCIVRPVRGYERFKIVEDVNNIDAKNVTFRHESSREQMVYVPCESQYFGQQESNELSDLNEGHYRELTTTSRRQPKRPEMRKSSGRCKSSRPNKRPVSGPCTRQLHSNRYKPSQRQSSSTRSKKPHFKSKAKIKKLKSESSTYTGLYERNSFSIQSLYRKPTKSDDMRKVIEEIKNRYSHIATSTSSSAKDHSVNIWSPESGSLLHASIGINYSSRPFLDEQRSNGVRSTENTETTTSSAGSQSQFSQTRLQGGGTIDTLSLPVILEKIYFQIWRDYDERARTYDSSSRQTVVSSHQTPHEDEERQRAGASDEPIFQYGQVQSLFRSLAVLNHFRKTVDIVADQMQSDSEDDSVTRYYLLYKMGNIVRAMIEVYGLRLCNLLEDWRIYRPRLEKSKNEEEFEKNVYQCILKLKNSVSFPVKIKSALNFPDDKLASLDELLNEFQESLIRKLDEICDSGHFTIPKIPYEDIHTKQMLPIWMQEILDYLRSDENLQSSDACPIDIMVLSNHLAHQLLEEYLM